MPDTGETPVARPFGRLEKQEWRWARTMTRAALMDRVRSRSSFITAAPERRAAYECDLAALFDELELHDGSTIALPYVTVAFRGQRD